MDGKLALTPALSPGEREKAAAALELFQRKHRRAPLGKIPQGLPADGLVGLVRLWCRNCRTASLPVFLRWGRGIKGEDGLKEQFGRFISDEGESSPSPRPSPPEVREESRQHCPSPGASGGVMRQKVRRPTHSVRLPMHNVSHPIQNVDSPTRSVSLPMHNYRHPMHYVRLPTHFIAIRWGFCAFVGTKCPKIGKSVQKRDTGADRALPDSLSPRQQRGERAGERGNLLG